MKHLACIRRKRIPPRTIFVQHILSVQPNSLEKIYFCSRAWMLRRIFDSSIVVPSSTSSESTKRMNIFTDMYSPIFEVRTSRTLQIESTEMAVIGAGMSKKDAGTSEGRFGNRAQPSPILTGGCTMTRALRLHIALFGQGVKAGPQPVLDWKDLRPSIHRN
ncbi:hypothetical protein BD410DRAFT_369275 [Rickenella mellea]|uniref:Uncharacterized protein n=1 Tax=Rickenella mellea TaxID=50990 RepID=A0A4Y7PZ18_9AGAM|nr:hypothetical protein BD410DRAFT_369275 [Rickenella mellea]